MKDSDFFSSFTAYVQKKFDLIKKIIAESIVVKPYLINSYYTATDLLYIVSVKRSLEVPYRFYTANISHVSLIKRLRL